MPHRIPKDWPPVRLIAQRSELDRALEEWERAGVLGVDTESNSFFAYYDQLCLFQVSTDEADYIVDPIALGEDLKRVNELLADERIIKIFHSAEFDLMLLRKDLGATLGGLFDTQIAMTLLRHDKTGLAALIESFYGIKLSKKEQRSNWGKRPLSPAQVAYARIDTHFLPDLYRRLKPELEQAGLTAAAEGEFRRLEREVLPERQPDLEGWRRMRGARDLDHSGGARLRELFLWREGAGQKQNLPVFRVLGNEALLELARRPPRDLKELSSVAGVGWRKARQVGDELFEALQRAAGKKADPHPRKPATREEIRKRRAYQENQDALRQWRKNAAAELGLPSERLMHRRHLEEIGRLLPRTSEELMRAVELNDWQREHLEQSLLKVLARLPDPEQA